MRAYVSCLLILATLFVSTPGTEAWAASAVSVSPATITADYKGTVTVNANVGTGDQVVLSLVPDYNGNGVADGTESALWAYVFADEEFVTLPHAGRVLDRDGAQDGRIQAVIPFFDAPHFAGKFTVTVKDSGPAARASLTVNAPAEWTQRVTGSVMKGATPQTGLVLAFPRGADGELEVGGMTNQAGAFSLALPEAGSYEVATFAPGLLSDLGAGSGALATVNAGQTVALFTPLLLFDGDYTVSGKIELPGGAGVPYMFTSVEYNDEFGEDPGFIGFGLTDANGNFSIPTKSGPVAVSVDQVNRRGIVVENEFFEVTDANVTGVIVSAYGINAVISGTVTNLDPAEDVHVGLPVYCQSQSGEIDVEGVYTDASGQYSVGVIPGDWGISLDSGYVGRFGYSIVPPAWRPATVTLGQRLEGVDFTIAQADGELTVSVREGSESGPGVPWIGVVVNDATSYDWVAYQETNDLGEAVFPLMAGTYRVNPDYEDLWDRGYVQPPDQEVTISQGSQESLVFVVEIATATATLRLWDVNGYPVSGAGLGVNRVVGSERIFAGYAETDGSGQAAIPLLTGDYEASIWNYPDYPGNYVWFQAEFSVSEGENALVDLYLYPKQANLNVQVRDTSMNPVTAGVVVTDELRGVNIAESGTDSGGNAWFQVPAISLRVELDSTTIPVEFLAPDSQYVTPPAGGTSDVTFVLEPVTAPFDADLNGDQVVDKTDLLILMSQWGQTWEP